MLLSTETPRLDSTQISYAHLDHEDQALRAGRRWEVEQQAGAAVAQRRLHRLVPCLVGAGGPQLLRSVGWRGVSGWLGREEGGAWGVQAETQRRPAARAAVGWLTHAGLDCTPRFWTWRAWQDCSGRRCSPRGAPLPPRPSLAHPPRHPMPGAAQPGGHTGPAALFPAHLFPYTHPSPTHPPPHPPTTHPRRQHPVVHCPVQHGVGPRLVAGHLDDVALAGVGAPADHPHRNASVVVHRPAAGTGGMCRKVLRPLCFVFTFVLCHCCFQRQLPCRLAVPPAPPPHPTPTPASHARVTSPHEPF